MNKHRNELLTKLDTIIKDKNTPETYKMWLKQVKEEI